MPEPVNHLQRGTRFLPILRRDDATRMVYGYLTTEAEDSYGTVFTLDATREALQDYKNWRNLRAMHQAVAAGWVPVLELDDRGLWIGARVVDDGEWKKVCEGVYKGFSIGFDPMDGRYEMRGGHEVWVFTRYVLVESSLVDRNSNPEAVITLWRSEAPYMLAPADAPWDFDHAVDGESARAALGDAGAALCYVAGLPVAKLAAPGDTAPTLNRFALEAARAALDGAKELALSDDERAAAKAAVGSLLALFSRARRDARPQQGGNPMDKQQLDQAVETGIRGFFTRLFGLKPGETPATTPQADPPPAPQARVALAQADAQGVRAVADGLKARASDASLPQEQRAAAGKAAADLETFLGQVEVRQEVPPPKADPQVAALTAQVAELTRNLEEVLTRRASAETLPTPPEAPKSRYQGAFTR